MGNKGSIEAGLEEGLEEGGPLGVVGGLLAEGQARTGGIELGDINANEIGSNVLDEENSDDVLDRLIGLIRGSHEDPPEQISIEPPQRHGPDTEPENRRFGFGGSGGFSETEAESHPLLGEHDAQIEVGDLSGLRGRGFTNRPRGIDEGVPEPDERNFFFDNPDVGNLEDVPLLDQPVPEQQEPDPNFGPRRRGPVQPIPPILPPPNVPDTGNNPDTGQRGGDGTGDTGGGDGTDSGGGDTGTGGGETGTGGGGPTDKGTGGRTGTGDRHIPVPDSGTGPNDQKSGGFTPKPVVDVALKGGPQTLRTYRRFRIDDPDELAMVFETQRESRLDKRTIRKIQKEQSTIYERGKVTDFIQGDREVKYNQPMEISDDITFNQRNPRRDGRGRFRTKRIIMEVPTLERTLKEFSTAPVFTNAFHQANLHSFTDQRMSLKI